MNHKTIILLLSGGLDSVTAAYYLHGEGHLVHPLMLDYRQPHLQELTLAKQHCQRLRLLYTTLELPPLGGLCDGNWVVPNRNAIMLSVAVNLAVQSKSNTVAIGCNADDAEMFPDCRKSFLDAMNASVRAAGYEVEICAPFLEKKKWWIGGLARELGVPLHEIWSCYRGGVEPCGTCPACEKLKAALC